MVVHGIPGPYELVEGDLLSVDVGVTLDGYVADSAITFTIGRPSEQASGLIDACYEGLEAAIDQCRAGQPPRRRLPRRAGGGRGARLRRRPQPGRPRRRPQHARRPADPQLRPARPRPQAGAGDGVRDRADDHRRLLRRRERRRRLGRLHPRRQPGRPLRAHRRGHRQRPAGADAREDRGRSRRPSDILLRRSGSAFCAACRAVVLPPWRYPVEGAPKRQTDVREVPCDPAPRPRARDLHQPPAQAAAGRDRWHASQASTSRARSGSRSASPTSSASAGPRRRRCSPSSASTRTPRCATSPTKR